MVSIGEKSYFDIIKDYCQIIFDIGCREDIIYAENSYGKTFHMFEPNPIFYNACKNKIDKLDHQHEVHINSFGLGNKTHLMSYYEDAQSFFKRHVHFSSNSLPIPLLIEKFSEYIEENSIETIDFLKMDVEGGEPDILKDGLDFIRDNVKFIQFEYASTWMDRDDKVRLKDIFNLYSDVFEFFFIYNEDHPISEFVHETLNMIDNQETIDIIEQYVVNQYGFDIAMIRKEWIEK
jgi:FkbM family methyltransferase